MVEQILTPFISFEEVVAKAGLDDYRGMEIEDGMWVAKHKDDEMSVSHGLFGGELFGHFWEFVRQHGLGKVYMSETIFILDETDGGVKLMRKPDIAFVAADRLIAPERGRYYRQAPDIAVEVISPSERIGKIRKKLREYFTYGTRQVWLVYMDDREIVIYTSVDDAKTYRMGDTLTGSDVLPGFEIEVTKIFAA